ncbi:hypothetical protein NW754_009720 [Fusarium falciforme]|uniref:Uncharacterized protein n=1 Tax=Fusarium falciforme TaxID=195108 RepID=A0A9W8R1Z0_9HYPO|nr:hypothetical protein NW754_009720 [Fusarium falciforme]KAJ4185388.1 hypothetical protein NW755_008384 [Fusarium falciforme]KAJ4204865.1 hypothetical protein NW767_004375 [Fusarium falciforme]
MDPTLELPSLHDAPVRHPNCCLSFSSKLIKILTRIFSSTANPDGTSTVLSIGSGSGLLEALLLAHVEAKDDSGAASFNVEGVEVQQLSGKPPVNRYLPEQAIYTVRGTWDVVTRLQDSDVTALMFVYPRQPTLVTEYIKAIAEQDLGIQTIVWLGPMADWDVFETCFVAKDEHQAELEKMQGAEAGLDGYEMMAVLKITGKKQNNQG